MTAQLKAFIRFLEAANHILFITGAGISADSGLPTYRGVGGLYDTADTEDGIPIETALSGAMLRRRPELTWKYLMQIAHSAQGKSFNRAHQVIAALEQVKPRVCVLTQNIDGFHVDAGSRNVIEIHGNMRSLKCLSCSAPCQARALSNWTIPPRCPACQGILRPNVVLFGEMLPSEAIAALQREVQAGFDLVVSVGTSNVFPYIVAPLHEAARQGIPTVEINPSSLTNVSQIVDLHLPLRAAEALEAVASALGLPLATAPKSESAPVSGGP